MSCISCVLCRNNIVKNTCAFRVFFVEIILSRIRMKIQLTCYAEEYYFFLQGAAVHRLGFLSKSKHERLFVFHQSKNKVTSRARPWSIFKCLHANIILSLLTFTYKKRLRKLQKRRRLCQKLDTGIIHDCSCINEFH